MGIQGNDEEIQNTLQAIKMEYTITQYIDEENVVESYWKIFFEKTRSDEKKQKYKLQTNSKKTRDSDEYSHYVIPVDSP